MSRSENPLRASGSTVTTSGIRSRSTWTALPMLAGNSSSMPFVEHLMWMGFKDGLRGLTAPSPALGYRPGIMENSMVERSKDAPENAVGDDLGTVPDHAAVSAPDFPQNKECASCGRRFRPFYFSALASDRGCPDGTLGKAYTNASHTGAGPSETTSVHSSHRSSAGCHWTPVR